MYYQNKAFRTKPGGFKFNNKALGVKAKQRHLGNLLNSCSQQSLSQVWEDMDKQWGNLWRKITMTTNLYNRERNNNKSQHALSTPIRSLTWNDQQHVWCGSALTHCFCMLLMLIPSGEAGEDGTSWHRSPLPASNGLILPTCLHYKSETLVCK